MLKSKFLIQIFPVILFGTISIVGLTGCQSKTKLDLAIEQLSSKQNSDLSSRDEKLVEEFKQIGKPAVTKLLPLLEDKNFQVRASTAYILGEMGENAKSAAPKLMPLIKGSQDDNAWNACERAVEALGRMGAVSELIAALKKDDWNTDPSNHGLWDNALPERIANASIEIGAPMIPALTTVLSDPKPNIRQRAASILGQMGATAKSAVPTLTKTLTDSDRGVRIETASALGQMGATAKSAVPTLTKTLADSDPHVRIAAASALGRIGATAPAIATLTKTLANSDPHVRVIAASALVRIEGAKPIVFPVFNSALTGGDDSAKSQAIETLGEMGRSATPAIPALLTVLKDPDLSADAHTRTKAAEALAQIGADAQLIAALKDPASIVRWRAAYALGRAGYSSTRRGSPAKTAVPTIVTALEDPDETVRHRAVEALGNIGAAAKTAVPALTTIANDRRDIRAKMYAEEALRKIDLYQKVKF